MLIREARHSRPIWAATSTSTIAYASTDNTKNAKGRTRLSLFDNNEYSKQRHRLALNAMKMSG